jgi:hypothetical protein
MADDNRFRSIRPADPYRRAQEEPASGASDPLAELARLIGQNDPYAQFGLTEAEDREESYSSEPAAQGDWQRAAARAHYEQEQLPRSYHASGRDQGMAADEEHLRGWGAEEGRAYHDTQPQDDQHRSYARAYDEPSARSYQPSHPVDDYEAHEHAGEYRDDESALDPHADQYYDDPPRAQRRYGGLATALALIGCAMLGTAGAYAYRSYYAEPSAKSPPPVITADNSTPAKIVPPPPGDSQSAKAIQDRLANAGKEQLVSKQEEPVAMKDIGTQASPRVVLPAPVAPAPPSTQQAPVASPAGGPGEGKKVRTVTIRPDGTEASRPASAPQAGRSVAPLSLDPQAAEPAPPPAPSRARTAAAPAAAASSGAFVVQLSSQKTEAEATASFRSLQAKFPDELGGRTPLIRRADLGAKGVFYRTMVGPFASAQEAHQFCASFKAAGGQCVVPSN